MAKKTHSLKTFTAGYNSKVAPRDLKDDALAKSQGITVERPGVLSVLGKANHLSGHDYSYDGFNTSSDVLGDARGPINDPGSGLYSFSSEFTYGYIGRFAGTTGAFARLTGSTPDPCIRITTNVSTPVHDKATDNDTSSIPLQAGDWIYIWGIANVAACSVFNLNDRYFKVVAVDGTNNYIDICDYTYGANAAIDINKFTNYNSGGSSGIQYVEATHGGFWKTMPEHSFTRYTLTQNGECMDLHYDVVNSDNEFSKATIPIGTLGLTSNSAGIIGKLGNDTSLDLGFDNNFEKWPISNGVNYGLKPSFFFTDNVVRMFASNRVGRPSSGDELRYGNPKWFGHIHREKLFGIDSSVTNINEWYYTDSNIRPPARNINSTITNFGDYADATLVDKTSWETGTVSIDGNSITSNHLWADTKRFTENEADNTSWHDWGGNIKWIQIESRNEHCDLSTLSLMARYGKSTQTRGGLKSNTGMGLKSYSPDGNFRISQLDANPAGSGANTALEYWHSPGSGSFDSQANHVTTAGVNSWTWNRNATTSGFKGQSVTKAATDEFPLFLSQGNDGTSAAFPSDTHIVITFSLTGCTVDVGGTHGLDVYVQNNNTPYRVKTGHTNGKQNYHQVSVRLTSGASTGNYRTNWLLKFVPSVSSWTGTISNVNATVRNVGGNAISVGWNRTTEVPDTEEDFSGWDKSSYEVFQTLIYDTKAQGKQESCATLMETISMDYSLKRTLKMNPVIMFSRSGESYDMMDKRITGSNIYFRKKLTDSGSVSHDKIMLLLEMDWQKGCRQWGGGTSGWIEWTQTTLDVSDKDYDMAYNLDDGNTPTLDITNVENSAVVPKLSAKEPYFEWKDAPITNPTYEVDNHHPHDESGVGNARYGTMAAVNGVTYIGNVAIPLEKTSGPGYDGLITPHFEYFPSTIIRSAAGKNDMYPLTTDILDLTGVSESRIIKMYGLANYLVVLCINSYFVLNLAQGGLQTLANNPSNGIKHECQSVQTDNGVIWVNDKGCFFFGNVEGQYGIVNLIDGKISKDKRGWVNNNKDSGKYEWDDNGTERPNRTGLYYWDIKDTEDYVPSVGYDANNNKLIIKKSCKFTGNYDEGHIFIYDFYTKTWTTNINGIDVDELDGEENDDSLYSSVGYYSFAPLLSFRAYTSNFNTLSDGELVYHVKDGISGVYKWHNSPHNEDNLNNINVSFKELTFDFPHNFKRIYQIYVTYRCTGDSGADMDYGLDGDDNFNPFNKDEAGTGYNNSFNDTSGKWAVASLLPGGPINCYSIQLRLIGRAVPADFEINDITFVYKTKNVKVRL